MSEQIDERLVELLRIAESLRWNLQGFVSLYDDTDQRANRAIERYEDFVDKHELRSVVEKD